MQQCGTRVGRLNSTKISTRKIGRRVDGANFYLADLICLILPHPASGVTEYCNQRSQNVIYFYFQSIARERKSFVLHIHFSPLFGLLTFQSVFSFLELDNCRSENSMTHLFQKGAVLALQILVSKTWSEFWYMIRVNPIWAHEQLWLIKTIIRMITPAPAYSN